MSLFSDSDDEQEKKVDSPKKEKILLKNILPQKEKTLLKNILPQKEKNMSPAVKKKKPSSDSTSPSKKSTSMTSVQTHDNADGPICPKCEIVCKDFGNLKNHLLSHFYPQFYELLPGSKPFPCPICEKENRDRITLLRHYAFAHNKAIEITGIDFSTLNQGVRRAPRTPGQASSATPKKSSSIAKKATPKPKVKSEKKEEGKSKPFIDDDDSSDDEDFKRLMARTEQKVSGKWIFF